MNTPTPEAIEKLKSANPSASLTLLEIDGQGFVVKPPPKLIYAQYFNTLSETKKVYDANEYLCRFCVIWPDELARDDLFEKTPGIVNQLGAEIAKLGQTESKVTAKKL